MEQRTKYSVEGQVGPCLWKGTHSLSHVQVYEMRGYNQRPRSHVDRWAVTIVYFYLLLGNVRRVQGEKQLDTLSHFLEESSDRW